MNQHIPPLQPPAGRRALRFWLIAVGLVLASLLLVAVAPTWAAAPVDVRQGTVPPPPGGGDDDDDEEPEDPSGSPEATPTPGAPAAIVPPVGDGTPVAPAGVTGVVTALRLNVRSGPGAVYPVLGSVTQDQRITIQYRNTAGDWWYSCCVTGTTTSGWVSALFIRPEFDATLANSLIPVAPGLPAESVAPVATLAPLTGTTGLVNVFRLNLRSEPSTSGAIVGKLLEGESVEILSRNAAGDWWYVCCLSDTVTEGWVSAEFITPGFERDAAADLLPLYGAVVRAILPTPTPKPLTTPAVAMTSSMVLTTTVPGTTTLGVRLWQEPEFAGAGEALQLRFVISNTGPVTATQVAVRDELQPELALAGGEAGNSGLFAQSRARNGNTVFTLEWPELAPGSELTATVALTLAATLSDGVVLDTIAAVSAANAPAETAGVLIGLPPVALPDFQ